jgi:uncharacterized lipoprotein YbaY
MNPAHCAPSAGARCRSTAYAIGAMLVLAACGSTAPKPKIGFSPSTVTLTATAGATASGSVEVKNVGGGTLSGVSASVGAYSTGASGWLTVTLSGATAPASLELAANTATVSPGSYSAVVNVSAAGASPPTATLTVNLTVTQ